MIPPGRWRSEADDMALLALAAVLVPATWWLLLGWSWPDLIAGHDGVATVFLAIRELVEAKGRWAELAYRADLFGGMKMKDAIGPLPVLALLARLPLSPTTVFNVFTFLVQITIAFLAVRTATDLAAAWTATRRRPTWLEGMAGVWMCGFAPALAWRLGYGHHTLVVGTLPFLAAASLLAAAGAGTVTVTLVVVAAAALVNGILFTGHQLVLYSVVFGGPILVGLWKTCGVRPRALGAVALTCLAAFLIALPGFYGVLHHASSGDSLRALGRMELTYAWLTSHPLDWLTSIPWTRQALPFRRPVLYHHEINYAAGPLLALLALVPWRRAKTLALGVAASVVLVLLFSMNVRPYSDALLFVIPPLNTFRVPPRAILPALLLLPSLVLAAFLVRSGAGGKAGPTALLALAAGGIFFFLPSLAREAVGWAVAVALVWQTLQRRRAWPAAAWTAVLCVIAAGSVAAFRERLLPFVHGEAALAQMRTAGEEAIRAQPALASPLVRVSLGPEAPGFEANTAFAARLSALEGYFFPLRRFVELLCALRGQEYRPNQLITRFPEDHPTSRPMFQLYDVAWRVRLRPGNGAEVTRLTDPAGPAWFSAGLTRVDSYAALGRDLLAVGDDLGRRAHEALWLVTTDPRVAAARLPVSVDPACASARVREVRARRGTSGVAAVVEVPADCPLTFAMNYAETLRATATVAGQSRPATVFPAYGALAAVWVPAGATEVHVEAAVTSLPWPAAWGVVGLGLGWILVAYRALRPPGASGAGPPV
jgi:hypothetical protein